jgi:hypothetical protein
MEPKENKPETGSPSIGLLIAVGVVSGLVTGTVTAIASLSPGPGLGLLLGVIVGLISMAFASERLSLLRLKRRPRR